jgi:hypothetical protein
MKSISAKIAMLNVFGDCQKRFFLDSPRFFLKEQRTLNFSPQQLTEDHFCSIIFF